MKYKIYIIKKRMFKLIYKFICLVGFNHINFLKKHNVFEKIGDNCFYQPTTLPNEPKLIKLNNNVKIATNVFFYTHDVINSVFSVIDKVPYDTHSSCIEIYDNVFIGANSVLIGPLKIGPNAIVAAGSVVTKNVEEGTIVGGNPAKVIGKFEDLKKKRKIDKNSCNFDPENNKDELWKKFYNKC